MLFGLDGVELGLIIVFLCLFSGILSGFPVAFAIGGAGVISFGVIAALDSAGILVHQAIDEGSQAYRDLVNSGINPLNISTFRYPELPRIEVPVFTNGWEQALDRNLSFIVNRMNERVFAGQSIEVLLAVLMFVLMGITLERSRIAEDLLTTMGRIFGPLPGGLAVSVVVVGAFLAASTGIVGATVITMGLLSLPTMLRNGYSPELSTGVIAASGTLGQIIPPSIVIVLLGSLVGDVYAAAQDARAQAAGCPDALTFLGEAAVISVGTLFQAALLPGIFLAGLYGLYALGFAIFNPSKAPPVASTAASGSGEVVTRSEALTWFLGVPAAILIGAAVLGFTGLAGTQTVRIATTVGGAESASLRTSVPEACKASMIELHGQRAWDRAVAEQEAITAAGPQEAHNLTEEERVEARRVAIGNAPPLGTGILAGMIFFALMLSLARGVRPMASATPLIIGAGAIVAILALDALFITPTMSSGATLLIIALPLLVLLWAAKYAAGLLATNELLRVVFPPLILIVAVLGSILGGITAPTPAAALGAAGAIMLAAYRRLHDEGRGGKSILIAALAIVVMILIGINFDLRLGRDEIPAEDWVAWGVAMIAYHIALIGLLWSCWVLLTGGVLTPVVRETAKVTSMVFTILIGSQLLNLVVISFGGEHYIQDFLRSFDQEWVTFLIVMLVLFILGFVLDFLEIIYIVIPIVGPVIYGGTLDPAWVTIMIAVNLQTSFLTPPFGFALFYLRGVAPPEVTTGHIYRGVAPFVLIQVVGLGLLWLFPSVVTILPALIGH